jgi:hypothetical protein
MKKKGKNHCNQVPRWLTPVIPAAQEVEMRRIEASPGK